MVYIHSKLKQKTKPNSNSKLQKKTSILYWCMKTMAFSIDLSTVLQNMCHNVVGPIGGGE